MIIQSTLEIFNLQVNGKKNRDIESLNHQEPAKVVGNELRDILLYSGPSLSRLPSILKISHYFSGPVNIFTKYNLIYYLCLEYPSLKKKLWSRLNYSLPISNFLLACSVIQVSYRVSYENTIESFHFEYLENLECEFQNAKHPGD